VASASVADERIRVTQQLEANLLQVDHRGWHIVKHEAQEAWEAFREGCSESWRDQTKSGWKNLAYKFYVEPFVLLWRLAKRALIAVAGR
jgi:hypothetical protein